MERRDLYNENRELTGETIYKDDEIPNGKYILIVMAFIQNLNGEFLIQKRSISKGGEWSFTGGHPKSGESSLEGIKVEVMEEIGVDIKEPILFKQAKGKNTFCDLYYIRQDVDINSIILQKEEVTEVLFKTKDEIDKMFQDGIFKKGHYLMFNDCINYLNNNEI